MKLCSYQQKTLLIGIVVCLLWTGEVTSQV